MASTPEDNLSGLTPEVRAKLDQAVPFMVPDEISDPETWLSEHSYDSAERREAFERHPSNQAGEQRMTSDPYREEDMAARALREEAHRRKLRASTRHPQ